MTAEAEELATVKGKLAKMTEQYEAFRNAFAHIKQEVAETEAKAA